MSLALGALVLAAQPTWAQCSKYEMGAGGPFQKGQSVSILPFAVLDLGEFEGSKAHLEQEHARLQRAFGLRLTDQLKRTGAFSEVLPASAGGKPDTALVIDGSYLKMADVPGGIRFWLSLAVKRTAGRAEVLRLEECATVIEVNAGTSFVRSTPEMLYPVFGNIAFEVARTVQAAAGSAEKR